MKKLSLKHHIMLWASLFFFIFSIYIFLQVTNMYVKTSKDKVKSEIKISSKTAADIIEEEKNRLMKDARIVANDEVMFYAFRDKIYGAGKWKIDKEKKEAVIKIKDMTPTRSYSLINRMNSYIYQIGIGHIQGEKIMQFFDENLQPMSSTYDMPADISDSNNKMFLSDVIGKVGERRSVNATEISTFQKIGKTFLVKSASPIGKHTKLGDRNVYGVVVVERIMNKKFLYEIKSKINKELLVVSEGEVATSTFDDELSNTLKQKIQNLKIEGSEEYLELRIGGEDYGFSFFPIYDYLNKKIGYIGVAHNLTHIRQVQSEAIRSFLIHEATAVIILLTLFLIMSAIEYKKFQKILIALENIKKGKYEERLPEFDRKEFKALADGINSLAESVEQREQKLKNINYDLEGLVQERTNELEIRNHSFKSILDNAGQGFLVFGQDFKIKEEYSIECEKIFEKELADKNIVKVLNLNLEQKEFFEETITDIFEEKNKIRKRSYISLLPNVLEVNGKILEIAYKVINTSWRDEILLVITDITEKKKLEELIEKEKIITDMLINVVKNRKLFNNLIKEFRCFVNEELAEMIKERLSKAELLSVLLIKIHTFKGSFSQMGLENTFVYLAELEEKLFFYKKNSITLDTKEIEIFIKNAGFLIALEDDLKIIKKYLGDEFLKKEDMLEVKKTEIDEVINLLKEKSQEDDLEDVIDRLKKLKRVDIKDLVYPYRNYSKYLAHKYNKEIEEPNFIIEDIYVSPEKYGEFFKSLVHIFNNIFSHGIEGAETRYIKGKSEKAKVECQIYEEDKQIVLRIKDDGAGIDFNKVREKLFASPNYDMKAISMLTKEDLIDIIMSEDFTTKQSSDELSGKGVGMYAVRLELEKLNGKLKVETEKNKGTEFIFNLPLDK